MIGLLAAAVLVAAGQPAAAPAPDTQAALLETLESVCRPSTEADVPPQASATRLHYAPVATPPNLATGKPLRAWLAPSPGPGKIYLLDGGLPDSAQAGCILAVYGEALPKLSGAIQERLVSEKAGFQPNPTLSVSGPRQSVAKFDRRKGDVVTSIMVIQTPAAPANAPSVIVAVSRVDYGWMTKLGH